MNNHEWRDLFEVLALPFATALLGLCGLCLAVLGLALLIGELR